MTFPGPDRPSGEQLKEAFPDNELDELKITQETDGSWTVSVTAQGELNATPTS